jgi:hypothetical protein
VACGGVLAGEGVGGGASEVPELQGGKGEARAASIGEGRALRGHSPKRDGRRHSGVNSRWGGRLRRPRGDGRRRRMKGVVCLGSDEGAEKRKKGRRQLLKTSGRAG